MKLEEIRAPVRDDMEAVNRLVQERLSSSVALINQLGAYIVNSGGKRLRPLVVLMAARAAGDPADKHLPLAAVIEFIHTATLLHDDVVDDSRLRRGQETANHVWGNEASVLVGDFLYSRAFEMMVELESMAIMAVMARTTNVIAEGEVLQLMNCHDPDVTEDRYREIIYRKTATLFEAGCRCAGLICGAADEVTEGLAAYGLHLGNAFQLVDDALDYGGDVNETGKNLGDDLAEGKPTLPLIHALRESDGEQAALLRRAIEEGGLDNVEAIQQAIENTGAIAYTRRAADQEADKAVQALSGVPGSEFREALERLVRFAVDRRY
ncbi:octaprenyl diphosphate synthase [Ectothiorhodospiraceae bacterium WFHF3C12]|nr:octaprenyl diphosphate synthase [Ectothiorhodospiraceae bacterium WFHF3C12]